MFHSTVEFRRPFLLLLPIPHVSQGIGYGETTNGRMNGEQVSFTSEHLFDVDEFGPDTAVELLIGVEKILFTFDDRGTVRGSFVRGKDKVDLIAKGNKAQPRRESKHELPWIEGCTAFML